MQELLGLRVLPYVDDLLLAPSRPETRSTQDHVEKAKKLDIPSNEPIGSDSERRKVKLVRWYAD